MTNKVFPTVRHLVDQVEETQQENIEAAAQMVAKCIMDGGIIQAWGGIQWPVQWKSRIAPVDSFRPRKLWSHPTMRMRRWKEPVKSL